MVIKIRLHGRGGQGVVTAAELLALAAFSEGWQAQAFPVFGVERTGAPIQSFVRLSKNKILSRAQIYQPDIIIIQDPTLLSLKNTLDGVSEKTIMVINSEDTPKQISQQLSIKIPEKNIFTAPATAIALKVIGKNIVNTVTLGIFVKATKLIKIESLHQAINHKFADKGNDIIKKNCQAINQAYQYYAK